MATFRDSQGNAVSELNIIRMLNSGTAIASINDITLYAPAGGGGSSSPSVESLVGKDGIRKSMEQFNDGDSIQLTEYPQSNRWGDKFAFRANISVFSKIRISFGQGTYGLWLEIDDTNLYVCKQGSTTPIAHGLTISEHIEVIADFTSEYKINVTINTLNGYYERSVNYGVVSGVKEVMCIGSVMTNAKFSATNPRYRCPVWVFGASFESTGTDRWVHWCESWGYSNFLLNAYPGRASIACFGDFEKALVYGTPRYLLWTMFGNGTPDSLRDKINQVKALGESLGFDVILTLRPSSRSQTTPEIFADRREQTDIISNSGCRVIDYSSAVLASNGDGWSDWRSGYIAADGKHPTALGARAIAAQICVDFPEIMQY